MNLWASVENNNLKSVKSILENFPRDSINVPNDEGRTLLFLAARADNIEMVQLLLENGAHESVNIPDSAGASLLFLAMINNNIEMARLFLAKGAQENINTPDGSVELPLWWAVSKNAIEMVQLLLDNGAQVTKDSLNIAEGDIRELLERHQRVKAQVALSTCLLGVQRMADTIKDNPDNALYSSLALRAGLVPNLIFSFLNTANANEKNEKVLKSRKETEEEGVDNRLRTSEQQSNKSRSPNDSAKKL